MGDSLKIYVILTLLASLLLLFQNCGDPARSRSIFLDQEIGSSECSSIDCTASEELLWMQIREYEPYKIQFASLGSHFTVGGQCGVSVFNNHSFLWELREGFGTQQVIASGFSDDRCDLGQFQVPIIFNGTVTPTPDQRYQLSMEIVGISANGEQLSNPSPVSKASLDVIFTTEAP